MNHSYYVYNNTCFLLELGSGLNWPIFIFRPESQELLVSYHPRSQEYPT